MPRSTANIRSRARRLPPPARQGWRGDSQTPVPRKSDRILTQTDTIAAHQVIRISTVTKVGERDVIKVKPFARVMANLRWPPATAPARCPPIIRSSFSAANPERPPPVEQPHRRPGR